MNFKVIISTLLLGLNLIASEILTPQDAISKFYKYNNQLDDHPVDPIYDYYIIDTIVSPSFKCSKKFKKYSLEDFICNSNFNAFRDNYFASLYSIIIKENPNLKYKALEIARERIRETNKDCMIFASKEYEKNIKLGGDFVSSTVGCIAGFYQQYSSKLALMLYDNDKELFKKIFGDDYEKFKEAFEDTLGIGNEDYEAKNYQDKLAYGKRLNKFMDKYKKEYEIEYGKYDYYIPYYQYATDLIYILFIQYDLIDSTGKFK
ncbi:hypothetical protein [Campylobacter curvus]|uniref:hypothetical protein n=1 Tax=Campylobacter curvus TaxID=200 RepID=UPI00037FD5F7|nr:hypothetical protein [Campylobacter curvus]QKF60531.1 hypothetical protein CCVT_0213 [Campylobacter curvus]UEB50679.1 hypothetical protein LK426_04315 [Campylobacter curvus]